MYIVCSVVDSNSKAYDFTMTVTGLVVITAHNAGYKKVFTFDGMLVIRAEVRDIAYAKIHL